MRSVFVAVGAYLGRIDGETQCAIWTEEPIGHGFDPGRLISVDLALTPSAAAADEISWDAVQVDDCFSGPNGIVGGTSLGPRWPEIGLLGAVYLERNFVASLPAGLRPVIPPTGMSGHPYEYMVAVYWPHVDDPRAGNRYTGHHSEILEERGSLAYVAVYPRGRSDPAYTDAMSMWVDLASPNQCDCGPDSLTTIGVGSSPKQGVLFLLSSRLRSSPPSPSTDPR